MSTVQEKFLNTYREYETAVRDMGSDPKVLEDSIGGLESERLRMCRLFRNYLSHTPDPGFITPTEKMQSFLDKKVAELKLQGDVAKKHLKKPAAVMIDSKETLAVVLTRVLKLQRELVLGTTPDGYRIYSLYNLMQAYLAGTKTTKVGTVKPLKCKPSFVRPDILMQDINPDGITLCTDDGTKTGKLLGVVWF